MPRRFDNNMANYLERTSVNYGLNGLTACSVAYWIRLTSTLSVEAVILRKNATGWGTIYCGVVDSTTRLFFAVESSALGQAPRWILSTGIGTGTWTRVLWTWQRNTIDVNDTVVYVNGQSVSRTLTMSGYTGAFIMSEISDTMRYGLFPSSAQFPLDADMAWATIWNRQLSAAEAVTDYDDPRTVTSGMLSSVELCPDTDRAFGGTMTVNGTLACVNEAPFQLTTKLWPGVSMI